MSAAELSPGEARRIALAAQGFDRARPKGRVDARHIRRTIRQLGLLQIDYVNVLVPSQYLVPFSRLGPYDPNRLDALVYDRREFLEAWAHEASIVPVEHWPLLRHRRESHVVRPSGFEPYLRRHRDYVDSVLEEVRARGPLTADQLPEPRGALRRVADKWGFGMAVKKIVLESHFGSGRLVAAERKPNFARVYDLAERVIPSHLRVQCIEADEAQRELLLQAARSHGIATPGDLADYYRMPVRQARACLAELAGEGRLSEVRVEGWRDAAYLHPEARRPRAIDAAALLSPFDPVVWTRRRAARLFGFDYKIEIFVPRSKRKWGYYVLPFLHGDRLSARVDLKAARKEGRLLVLASYLERGRPAGVVAKALAGELETLGRWLQLDEVRVSPKGNLARALAAAVRRRSPRSRR